MSNILYVSVHAVLERDEVLLLQSLGHNVYSRLALATHPLVESADIDKTFSESLIKEVGEAPVAPAQYSDRFLEAFDVVIVMHDFNWLQKNRARLKGKRVILRTIGQYLPPHEAQIKTLEGRGDFEIVRYSPAERSLPNYAGEEAMIRFYKDPARFQGWKGNEPAILTFGNSLPQRATAVSLSFLLQATNGFDYRLYGGGNYGLAAAKGVAKSEDMPGLYRSHRVFYSHHTFPASYTLSFLEALMTGAPVVSPGPQVLRNAIKAFAEVEGSYEVPQIIQHRKNGFVPNTVEEAHSVFASLLADPKMAAEVGAAGRKLALELFGLEPIKAQWKKFLG